MFELDWGKLVIIGVVALIAIGPKELPGVLRTLGQWMGKIRRMSAEFQGQFQEALREAEMADLKQHAEDIQSSVRNFTNLDPLAETPKSAETTAGETAVAELAPASAEAANPPPIDVPLPEIPAPVTTADFAPPTTPEPPPATKAEGGA